MIPMALEHKEVYMYRIEAYSIGRVTRKADVIYRVIMCEC